jgi:undecaprenyl-diphosphatase
VIARWDRAVVEGFQHLHWGPADWVFVHLSDWWVKSLVILAIALVADLWWRRFPLAVVLGTVSYLVAAVLSGLLKGVFDRPRPSVVDPAVHPLVFVPHNGSMPSTHAATAFAAAVAVSLVHPRLSWPLVALASLVSVSRVWLGVHYPTDVLAGAALGTAIAFGLNALLARTGIIRSRTSSP